MSKVDMHVINYKPGCKQEWFDLCLKSLECEDVDLTIIPNDKKGCISLLRYDHFIKSKHQYISYVDDDDMLIPGIVKKAVDFLELEENKKYCGIYTNLYKLNNETGGKNKIIRKEYDKQNHMNINRIGRPFHFMLFRNEAMNNKYINLLKEITISGLDTWTIGVICGLYSDWFRLNEIGYIWRDRSDSSGKVKKENGQFVVKDLCKLKKLWDEKLNRQDMQF